MVIILNYLQETLISLVSVGDEIQILFRNEENLAGTGVVNSVSKSTKTIDINPLSDLTGGTFTPDPNRNYDIRRVIKRANSTSVDIEFGDNVLTSDVTNVYNDSNEKCMLHLILYHHIQ